MQISIVSDESIQCQYPFSWHPLNHFSRVKNLNMSAFVLGISGNVGCWILSALLVIQYSIGVFLRDPWHIPLINIPKLMAEAHWDVKKAAEIKISGSKDTCEAIMHRVKLPQLCGKERPFQYLDIVIQATFDDLLKLGQEGQDPPWYCSVLGHCLLWLARRPRPMIAVLYYWTKLDEQCRYYYGRWSKVASRDTEWIPFAIIVSVQRRSGAGQLVHGEALIYGCCMNDQQVTDGGLYNIIVCIGFFLW